MNRPVTSALLSALAVLALTSSASWAQSGHVSELDGHWFVGDIAANDLDFEVHLAGGEARLKALDSGEELVLTYSGTTDGVHRFVSVGPSGVITTYLVLPQGTDIVLLWRLGEDEMTVGRRVGPVPEDLQGVWTIAPNDDPPAEFTFESNRFSSVIEGVPREGVAYGATSLGTSTDLVIEIEPGEFVVLQLFEVVAGEAYLAIPIGQSEFATMYRAGADLGWAHP